MDKGWSTTESIKVELLVGKEKSFSQPTVHVFVKYATDSILLFSAHRFGEHGNMKVDNETVRQYVKSGYVNLEFLSTLNYCVEERNFSQMVKVS